MYMSQNLCNEDSLEYSKNVHTISKFIDMSTYVKINIYPPPHHSPSGQTETDFESL